MKKIMLIILIFVVVVMLIGCEKDEGMFELKGTDLFIEINYDTITLSENTKVYSMNRFTNSEGRINLYIERFSYVYIYEGGLANDKMIPIYFNQWYRYIKIRDITNVKFEAKNIVG